MGLQTRLVFTTSGVLALLLVQFKTLYANKNTVVVVVCDYTGKLVLKKPFSPLTSKLNTGFINKG